MYKFYKIIGSFSKFFSNVFLALSIPVSIIMCGLGWCMFFIKDIIKAITPDNFNDLFNPQTGNATFINSMEIIKWVGLALAIFIIIIFILMLVAWIVKKVLYKKIADNYITRNKEWRNRDINKVIERLETYRYRD